MSLNNNVTINTFNNSNLNVDKLEIDELYGGSELGIVNRDGKTIINICSTRYLFKQSPGSVDSVVDFFNLSERNKKLFNNS